MREAVANALASVGCTWEELQAQAKAGCIRDVVARRVWIAVSAFLEPSETEIPNAETGRGLTEYQSVESLVSDV